MTTKTLWESAYTTDPNYTKGYKGAGGFSGTSIASLYPVQRATELFGAMGDGWGYEIITDEFIQGGPILDKETKALICHEQTHSMRLSLWANYEGKKLSTIGIGLTPHIAPNKYGVNTDHEAQKKTLTDAVKNGLKNWGFSADVYMGLHDDQAYVKAVKDDVAIDKADDKAAEILKQQQEYEVWKETNLSLMEKAVSVNELEALYKAAQIKAKRKDDDDYIKKIVSAAKTRKADITEAAA